jgi:hypothetical protein
VPPEEGFARQFQIPEVQNSRPEVAVESGLWNLEFNAALGSRGIGR